jgi:dTDP-4-dehydrorhamnose reductase
MRGYWPVGAAMRNGRMVLRIACIGKNGQTARALAAAAAGQPFDFIQAGGSEADLRNAASLERFVDTARPDVLINAGAYNFVDRAETEAELAFAVNAEGPRILARLCRERSAAFIHMSTDCVFDGLKAGAYDEEDEPNPLSSYGASKFAGELAVEDEYPEALTVRVAWVFSEHGDNFVSKMIEFARARPVLRVVKDQVGPPTYAPDIATGLLRLARDKAAGASDLSGFLHLVSGDALDRASMAEAIMGESKRLGGPSATIEPISTAEFNAPAKRPLNARLSNAKAVSMGLFFTPWPEALKRSVAGVLARS